MERALPTTWHLDAALLRPLGIAGCYAGVVLALLFLPTQLPSDAMAYYSSIQSGSWYTGDVGTLNAFLYPPPFGQALLPLTLLPWAAFHLVWMGLSMAALVYLVGPVFALVALLAFQPVPFELVVGNIHLLLAAALVLGFRHSAAWAFLPLSKITPAVLMLREPERAARALLVVAGICAVSFVIAPHLWFEWFGVMTQSLQPKVIGEALNVPPLWVRLPLAVGLTMWGPRWLLPLALLISLPVEWWNSLAILVATPRLAGWEPRFR